MRILIVAAHPDDEVLGAGAVAARHADRGDEVAIAILGEGLSARHASRDAVPAAERTALREASEKAAAILGAGRLRLHDFPDNRFDSVALLDIVKVVEAEIADWQPEVVYTHFAGDLNIDHEITSRAVLTACRPLPGAAVRRILAFEVPSATGWGLPQHPFQPTVFADVSGTLERKVAALAAYDGELRPFPHPRSAEALRAKAAAWGSQSGLTAAEPFQLIREIAP
ncbi:PIG-L deacetylase family protein [Oceanibacterium hippocampi]|uniref:1D-myo-inositol 2-acetamido-2-deoxy-alpha-D-glucopyranoside deacetylase n=1 Tax=Oceanibacterium hippocampi TaxID=745714 RepID=A0A1Y5SHV8_9PROT|nr:PIG-L deacetylase family protein [Oceanibacterium hippocampi]SLN38174.1 1D-myo-inositol 2-acetamido-2-deoxy-alpha-D-glucopyranoside deacetylase [Oceanibacterium hippocampi]